MSIQTELKNQPICGELKPGDPEIIQLTNDAYNFFANNEPCLDEANLSEIEELKQKYAYGFTLNDVTYVGNSGNVSVTLVPNILVESADPYTHYFWLFNGWRLEYKYLEKAKIECRYFDTKTGVSSEVQVCDVTNNKFGKPQFKTQKGSVYPLWSNGTTHVISTFVN